MNITPSDPCPIHLIASSKNWIEGEATRQLEQAARLPGMRRVVGLPDLHPGKGFPVGAAMISRDLVYPFLIGNDIGCGMALWRTDLKARKVKPERLAERLSGLEDPMETPPAGLLESHRLAPTPHDPWLGTIGGGNHFAELQAIEKILDPEAARRAGLDAGRCLLLVHSGSRGLGEEILRGVTEQFGARGLDPCGEAGAAYLDVHDHAVAWARLNRELIARRFLEQSGAEGEPLLDACHNSLSPCELDGAPHWLHRKGAAPADQGLAAIPGSRGALSYLVEPLGPSPASGWSLPHGAGRKWTRSQCKGRLRERYRERDLLQTGLGGRVVCEDVELLYQEAPQAYKNIEAVIDDMVQAGLARVVATLRPLLTYKTRRAAR